MSSRAEQLRTRIGQSVWLDFIHRKMLRSGAFAQLVRDQGVVGVTSNPTIFQQALAEGDTYDQSIRKHDGLPLPELFETLAIEDIQDACDQLRQVYEQTDGLDGRVSIEVNPHLARDTQGTVEEACRLHRRVARSNVMVKVPATQAGLPAIRHLTAEGICINVTLIFSLARYREVIEAYLAGLERRVTQGLGLSSIRSVASFFVSRVDTKVDKALHAAAEAATGERRQHLESLVGRAAIANARLAYREFQGTFGSPRYTALAARGAHLQRPLWASTSTKNPAYRDVLYVEELAGPDTVDTMPLATLQAFNDHGVVESRIERDVEAAQRLFSELESLGIPVQKLIAELEPEGVQAFAASYDTLLKALEQRRAKTVSGAG